MNISREDAIKELARRGIDINHEDEMVETPFGKMNRIPKGYANSPELRRQMEELVNLGAGGPGIELLGKGAAIGKQLGKKAFDYVSPSKISEEAEKFRSSLGAESESENIANLSKRTQFAKKSGEEEALVPKRELYSKEGKSDLYKIGEENLPEGNLGKLAHEIEPGAEFGKQQQMALSSALKNYRKNGNVESFIEKSEDIFGIPELGAKAASKIEDALLMPTTRESKYFADEGVSEFYGKKGKLKSLHETYENKPTLKNYDALQSALKKEERKLARREKNKTITDIAEQKLGQLRENIHNIESDATSFFETLPENMQNLQREFSKKWATGPAKYADAELTLRRLASGKPGDLGKVTSENVVKLFTHPDEKTLAAIKEMGPSVGRNVIYSALNKIKPGEAKKMADMLLDLKRKKGFESFITPDIEKWAMEMSKRSKRSDLSKKALSIGGGALAGSALGPFGTVAGGLVGAAPYIKEFLMRSPKNVR